MSVPLRNDYVRLKPGLCGPRGEGRVTGRKADGRLIVEWPNGAVCAHEPTSLEVVDEADPCPTGPSGAVIDWALRHGKRVTRSDGTPILPGERHTF